MSNATDAPVSSSSEQTGSTNTTARSSTVTVNGPMPVVEKKGVSPFPGHGTVESPYLVDWEEGEKANPYTWSKSRKWTFTAVYAVATLSVAFASSCYSGAIGYIRRDFHISNEVGILGISLFVLGFALAPLGWSPLSEMYGRRLVFIISFFPFAMFNLGGEFAQNTETLLILRFFAGAFGASLLTVAGAALSDIWTPHERGLATALFALSVFLGPVLGPICGGYVAENVGWRPVYWMMFGFAMALFILGFIFLQETFAPTLLRRKAAKLQKSADAAGSGEHFIAKYDVHKKSTATVLKLGFAMPFQLLFGEIIVMALSLYTAIVYAILYLFFTAYPLVFQQARGWSPGKGALPFIALGVGMIIATALTPFSMVFYRRAAAKAGPGQRVPPEARLPMACIGGCMLPIGLFWFAWTSGPNVHWIAPTLAGIPFGCGMVLVFTSVISYLIDSYLLYAASALAANSLLRSILGAAFPLFSVQMYERLGLQWASSLLAFIALACAPMPFLFIKYGPRLRARSKFAPSFPVAPPTAAATEGPATNAQADAVNPDKVAQPANVDALEPEFAADAGEETNYGRKSNENPV